MQRTPSACTACLLLVACTSPDRPAQPPLATSETRQKLEPDADRVKEIRSQLYRGQNDTLRGPWFDALKGPWTPGSKGGRVYRFTSRLIGPRNGGEALVHIHENCRAGDEGQYFNAVADGTTFKTRKLDEYGGSPDQFLEVRMSVERVARLAPRGITLKLIGRNEVVVSLPAFYVIAFLDVYKPGWRDPR